MGTVPPWVTWVKDGQPVAGGDGLLLTEQGRRLHIPRAELAHAGHYTCLVSSAEGQEQREFDVVVHGKEVERGWWLGVGAGRMKRVVMWSNLMWSKCWTIQHAAGLRVSRVMLQE